MSDMDNDSGGIKGGQLSLPLHRWIQSELTCEGYILWAYTDAIDCNIKADIIFLVAYINKCDTDNGGCEHNCRNALGTYYCYCNDGVTLSEDGHSCECNVSTI